MIPAGAPSSSLLMKLRSGREPDRAIDTELAKLIGWTDVRSYVSGTVTGRPSAAAARLAVPGFTSSIDAAALLVLPGWNFEVAQAGRNGSATIDLFHPVAMRIQVVLPTPARALCFAAMMAAAGA